MRDVPLTCMLYVEVQGRSKWEAEEAGLTLIDRMKANGKLEVLGANRAGAVRVGPSEFVDTVELEVRTDILGILQVVLDYTPSVVEVVSPPSVNIHREELSELMRHLSAGVRRIAAEELELGDLRELPLPPLGYEESELAELVYEGRQILYDVSFETSQSRETTIKTLTVLGCGIDRIKLKEKAGGGAMVEATLVSPFDSLLAVTAFYTPRKVEVLDPSVIDVTALELQNGLMDVAGIVKFSLLNRDSRSKGLEGA